ncbi:MAG: gamma-glutamylcyclotransferase [Candidatus Azotimanducaceae bacterium WSBS_2022_MAG_OTU7]
MARPHNPYYLGESPLEDIARQISLSHGPSGSNKEYILELHQTLEQHHIQDTCRCPRAQFIMRPTESSL